jgi:hypothetical protein
MPVQSDVLSSRPRKASPSDSIVLTQSGAARARLRWRAIAHPGQKLDPARGVQPIAWDVADCDVATRLEGHCDVGRHLLATDGNPDGHYLVGGTCPRCPNVSTPPARLGPRWPQLPAQMANFTDAINVDIIDCQVPAADVVADIGGADGSAVDADGRR